MACVTHSICNSVLLFPTNCLSCRLGISIAHEQKLGKELLDAVLQIIPKSLSHVFIVHGALSCLSAMVAVFPVPDRDAFATVFTSGMRLVIACT